MNILGAQLEAEYKAAAARWPFLRDLERRFDLADFLLFAVGSRETHLQPEYAAGKLGDGGHGHRLFQLDDRWHIIPDGFDSNPKAQAEVAAAQLANLYAIAGDWVKALNRYNSGQDTNEGTTGDDYGPDVWEHRAYLEKHFGGDVSDLPPVDDSPPSEDPDRQRGPAPDPVQHG